ncbi:sugar ABC transporter ATP-binding protein [Ruixingdingia sedimenti]|uniref:Sugar ABC transporter ATP-binding protein n=1 Tax=Ruixingdingia sedimenti TaxID=3073604 RepID=A0ABU1F576_9RHOB|nr:sugar ABC transporter ATP-binding protein [Xinfangfangia sp. LG-4]MDR5652027.1 sugar ABC transporter ATP-binding protein [Xinfangfangia sp. LG-4]
MSDVVAKIDNLRKSYGTVEVLRGIDLAFRGGEIHAFLGANGAGKSTFLGCLSGAVTPSAGTITIRGTPHSALTPRQARDAGIGIIYQHFQVIGDLTVADNVFLGNEIRRWGVVDSRAQNARTKELFARLDLEIDPTRPLSSLSVGERQIVEIARALRLKPDLLILDEPTAALSEHEMKALHRVVRQLARAEGLAVVYVTHLIDEIEQIADKVTVLRDGQVVWTRPVNEADHVALAQAIAPNMTDRSDRTAPPRRDDAVLELRDYRSGYTGPVDLTLHRGEILGLYGLLGSGRTDLLESLIGARGRASGSFRLAGRDIAPRSPRAARDRGLALVASDRNEQSLFAELSALDNLLMPHFGGLAGSSARQRQLFAESAQRLQLRPARADLNGGRFSGGNAQKLMMGRWLFPGIGIEVLLLDEPTQGVDIGAREELYTLLRDFVATGGAVLVASSDPDEIVAIADRVLVLNQGSPVALLEDGITEERLVHLSHKTVHRSTAHAAERHLATE